jgi:hypothetical protein
MLICALFSEPQQQQQQQHSKQSEHQQPTAAEGLAVGCRDKPQSSWLPCSESFIPNRHNLAASDDKQA